MAVIGDDLRQMIGDVVQSVAGGDGGVSPGGCAPHRRPEATGVLMEVGQLTALYAGVALKEGILFHASNRRNPVLAVDLDIDRTGGVADPAEGPSDA